MNASPSPRRIWVTRPRNQSAGLQTRLIEIGLAPVMLPLLEIASADDPAPLHDALARLADYDLAIFVSPSALEKVFEALTAPWPEQLPVAVMGPGSAELAKQLAIARIIQPASQFDSAGLLQEPGLQTLDGKRLVLFHGGHSRESLPQALRERGAMLDSVCAYRRLPPAFDEARLVAELAAGCDGIIISSSESAQHLFRLAGDKTRQQLQSQVYFAPHRRIVDTLIGLGVQTVHLTATGDAGIMASITHYFAPDLAPGDHSEEQHHVG